jgi:hypothetical protein
MVRNSGWCLSGCFGHFSPPVAAVVSALVLSGCAGGASSFGGYFGGGSPPPPEPALQPAPAPEIPPSIRVSEVIGRWGYAAYHKPEDRVRTEAAARAQCNHPYVIGQGPTGGVMMYLADQSELQELRLKGSTTGRNYIGPIGEAGGQQDREVVSFDGRVMLLRFTDPEISGRYGTGVYVRCAPSAGGVAQRGKK